MGNNQPKNENKVGGTLIYEWDTKGYGQCPGTISSGLTASVTEPSISNRQP
jgi:hypothetical protein